MDDDLILEMIRPPRGASLDPARRLRLVATTITVALAAAGVTSLTTSALFTDTQTMSATDFTTGTVQIAPTMSGVAGLTLAAGNLAPGDTTFGAVTVDNAGSLELRYATSLTGANPLTQTVDLAAQLDLTLYAAPGGSTTDVAASCNPAGLAALTSVATSTGLPLATTPLLGSNAPGADPGDRTLGAQTSETLCVALHLPLATDNTFQGTTASVTFTFDAEQTANNG
jgi:hypothetical protein